MIWLNLHLFSPQTSAQKVSIVENNFNIAKKRVIQWFKISSRAYTFFKLRLPMNFWKTSFYSFWNILPFNKRKAYILCKLMSLKLGVNHSLRAQFKVVGWIHENRGEQRTDEKTLTTIQFFIVMISFYIHVMQYQTRPQLHCLFTPYSAVRHL